MPPFGDIEGSSGDGETLGEDGSTLREYGSTLREDFRESPPRTPPKALNLRGDIERFKFRSDSTDGVHAEIDKRAGMGALPIMDKRRILI